MKVSTLAFTVLLIFAVVFTSCKSPTQKVENAQENVVKADEALDKANEEYLADIEKYKQETNGRIAANDKSISEFNARIEGEKAEAKADYKRKTAALEQQNSDLKKRMDDYKADGKEKWESFKNAFEKDMNSLDSSFSHFTFKKNK